MAVGGLPTAVGDKLLLEDKKNTFNKKKYLSPKNPPGPGPGGCGVGAGPGIEGSLGARVGSMQSWVWALHHVRQMQGYWRHQVEALAATPYSPGGGGGGSIPRPPPRPPQHQFKDGLEWPQTT